MSWYGWLLLAVSLVGYVWGWRRAFRAIVYDLGDYPDWADVLAGAWCGTLLALLWPGMVMFVALKYVLGAHDPGVFARCVGGRSRAEKIRDRECAVAERERHIRELEREVGMS